MPTTRAMYMSSGAVWITLPKTTWSTCSGAIPARSIAARAASAPSSVGGHVLERAAVGADRGARNRGDRDAGPAGCHGGHQACSPIMTVFVSSTASIEDQPPSRPRPEDL